MTTITKTITIDSPDGDEIELTIEIDLEWSPGVPGSLSDSAGWEPLNVRLAED